MARSPGRGSAPRRTTARIYKEFNHDVESTVQDWVDEMTGHGWQLDVFRYDRILDAWTAQVSRPAPRGKEVIRGS